MYFLVTINYQKFLFDDSSTADKFAAIAKAHIVDDPLNNVSIEYITNEEAKKWLND